MQTRTEGATEPSLRRSPMQAIRHFQRSVVNQRIKKLRDRLDDGEVRQTRALVRAMRNGPPDVVAFGDSNWFFRAHYDTDQRRLPKMIADELGPQRSMHMCARPGYHPALMRAFIRHIEPTGARPVVIFPLSARLCGVAWNSHPSYSYARAIELINGFDTSTPLRRMRASVPLPSAADFARYESTVISTWAGEKTIAELRAAVLDPAAHGLDELERRRILYAYHHGERVHEGQRTIVEFEELGRALRALGAPVVGYETPVPIDEGVAMWGEQFRENVDNTFRLMREAFRRGYGDPIELLTIGTAFERPLFIDPADGSEHLNQDGRLRLAKLIAQATIDALEARR